MSSCEYFFPKLHTLRVSGEKAEQLLHGQFTNNIRTLKPNTGNENLLLNHKGKVQANLFVFRTPTDFLLFIPDNFYEIIFTHLQKLAPLSRVTLTNADAEIQIAHVIHAPQDWMTLPLHHAAQLQAKIIVLRHDRLGLAGFDLLMPKDCDLKSVLPDSSQEMSEIEIEKLRIEHGVPLVGVDVTEEHLPQEGLLDSALCFDKGCYLGQEIIARLHFRGHVNKILTRMRCDSQVLAPGSIITQHNNDVGKITSAVANSTGGSLLLGYVTVAARNSGEPLLANGQLLTPI